MKHWSVPGVEPWWHWVFIKGCLGWGIPCCLILAGLRTLGGQTTFTAGVWDAIPLSAIAGGIYGLGRWGHELIQALREKHSNKDDDDGE